MRKFRVKIRGWAALAVLLGFGGFWLFFQWRMRTTLDSEAVAALKPLIAGRLMDQAFREYSGRSPEQLSPEEQEALGKRLQAARRVEIKSIKAHGLGEHIVVRVEVRVDGKPPADGKTVRYYVMYYSTVLGWTFLQEVGPLAYWFGLI